MDIGTAKATPEERALVPPPDRCAQPDEIFSVARYQELAGAAVEDIWARGRLRCWWAAPACTWTP